MLILTIVQNYVKLPYLEVTFSETSYLTIFGLSKPIIYRPDEVFQIFCRSCISPWSSTSGKHSVFLVRIRLVIYVRENISCSRKIEPPLLLCECLAHFVVPWKPIPTTSRLKKSKRSKGEREKQ